MPDRNDCHRLHSVGWILPVSLVVAFAPTSEYHFQGFDEHPQSQYCNDYVSHITDLFLITTCKDTKKRDMNECIMLNINRMKHFFLSGYVVVLDLCNSEKFYLEDEC